MTLEAFFLLRTAETKERLVEYGYEAVSRILRREEALRRERRRETAAEVENA